MHYVILAYPTISAPDYEWIQKIRSEHDRQYDIVKPHFTIIFPTEKPSELSILKHAKQKVINIEQIPLTLTRAIVEENIFPKYFQVHLVASEPIEHIVKLHDLLYVGELASELKPGIPYVPHITVASNEDKAVMEKLADDINSEKVHIQGFIDKITVSSFDGTQVVDLEHIDLATSKD